MIMVTYNGINLLLVDNKVIPVWSVNFFFALSLQGQCAHLG